MRNETDAKKATAYTDPYTFKGRIPLKHAIPLGLQHVLAMFVGNLTPLIIICGACGIIAEEPALYVTLLQNAMLVAGLVTLVQLYSIGPIGGQVPIIMGTSSGFLGVMKSVAATMGGGVIAYGAILGASIVGGLFETVLGFFIKPLRKLFPPVVTGTVVLAIGLTYPLLEGIVCWLIIRCRLPGFTLRRGLDAAFVGIFGNVVGLGAGAVPMESYYLYHCGLPLGPGVGLMTLQYVFHKTTVLLYATVMLLLQHRWLAANTSGVMHYLPAAYCVVALVIVTLVLLCVSPLVQRLARWAMGFLPKTEPWQTRREKWLEQLDTLATESRLLLADKGRCARILAVQTLKLFLMFTLPWFCIRFMGLSCGLSFWQVQLLTSLMLFLSNALPNVAGMGSIETAFLLVFSSFMTLSLIHI